MHTNEKNNDKNPKRSKCECQENVSMFEDQCRHVMAKVIALGDYHRFDKLPDLDFDVVDVLNENFDDDDGDDNYGHNVDL